MKGAPLLLRYSTMVSPTMTTPPRGAGTAIMREHPASRFCWDQGPSDSSCKGLGKQCHWGLRGGLYRLGFRGGLYRLGFRGGLYRLGFRGWLV